MKFKNLRLNLYDFYFGKVDLFQFFNDELNLKEIPQKEYFNLIKRTKLIIDIKFPDLKNKVFTDYTYFLNPEIELTLPTGFLIIKKKKNPSGLVVKRKVVEA